MKEKVINIKNKVVDAFKKIKLPKIDFTKVKAVMAKIKESLKKIDFLKKIVELARKYRFILSMIFFCVAILTLILVATLGWNEFVVPICVLMILEVAMAVLLHRSELWLHGCLLVAQVVVGIVIARVPLTILCVIAYVVTTITLHFAFKKAVEKSEEKPVAVEKKEKKNK